MVGILNQLLAHAGSAMPHRFAQYFCRSRCRGEASLFLRWKKRYHLRSFPKFWNHVLSLIWSNVFSMIWSNVFLLQDLWSDKQWPKEPKCGSSCLVNYKYDSTTKHIPSKQPVLIWYTSTYFNHVAWCWKTVCYLLVILCSLQLAGTTFIGRCNVSRTVCLADRLTC